MTFSSLLGILGAVAYLLIHFAFILRAILRPHREPASRVAWVVVILVVPILGIVAYIFLGETNVGQQLAARIRAVWQRLPNLTDDSIPTLVCSASVVPERYAPLFRVGASVNGFAPVGGNRAELLSDSQASIDALVSDIDLARDHVHLVFYIWLPDHNGLRVVEALCRAAARGVICRVMADGLGSRLMLGSPHWQRLQSAGVRTATALPIGNPLLQPLRRRIDLRNHRKLVVIDGQITYCGSQNCADPEFRVKPRYAPWVDVMIRITGPLAWQNQYLFASDWMVQVDDDLSELLRHPTVSPVGNVVGQVIGTGPTVRNSAMPEMFVTLMYSARHELTITTPYFVPDEALQSALCACARRGVQTTLIVPARNDSWIVAAASRSYYAELLAAGVQLFEYHGGLLHTKSLTMDGDVTLVGSANIDRRSFELNYENNVLLYDPQFTALMRQRQQSYLDRSEQITAARVSRWPMHTRLINNTIAMLGPVL